jgi:hypothetical protein
MRKTPGIKGAFCGLLALLSLSGTASAASNNLYFYSRLDLPAYGPAVLGRPRFNYTPSDIGSDKSYAASPKAVRIAGRSFTLGLAIAGLLQPLGPLVAAGFLLVGVYNAKQLVAAVASKPEQKEHWDFIWTKNRGASPAPVTPATGAAQ